MDKVQWKTIDYFIYMFIYNLFTQSENIKKKLRAQKHDHVDEKRGAVLRIIITAKTLF